MLWEKSLAERLMLYYGESGRDSGILSIFQENVNITLL